jgi:hypothetical protein
MVIRTRVRMRMRNCGKGDSRAKWMVMANVLPKLVQFAFFERLLGYVDGPWSITHDPLFSVGVLGVLSLIT